MKNPKKQWIALSLLTLMLVKAWVLPLLYLDFEIRRDYIIANLCVNRDKPMMHCDGKCYLAKRIAEAKEKEARQAENDYLSHLLYQVMDNSQAVYSAPPVAFAVRMPVNYQYKSPFAARNAVADIFHPPLV
ncbi:hypothetical protein [Dyadobacter diqingensis]|uniref:hypothetical protein n=1 Tax=Dyadobacter diqingensis TaxID=2938121 RepID=UPI0020C47512|nr:hypothetical protein [Dyadobacter diqingensis]